MPLFPAASSWPVAAYRYHLNDPTRPGTPEDFRAAVRACGVLPPCPALEHMDSAEAERHGWGGFGDDDEIAILEPYIILLRRSFIKRVPATTLRAMIEAESKKWRDERGVQRVPAAIKREIKEAVQERLMEATIPSVRQVVVFIHQQQERVYILAHGGGTEGIDTQVRKLLDRVHGGRSEVRPISFVTAVGEMFPSEALPPSLPHDFMRYMLSKWGQTLRIGGVSPLTIEFPEAVELGLSDNGRVSATGDHEAERLLEERAGEDETTIRRATVVVRDELGEWVLKLGGDGTLLRATMPSVGPNEDDDGAMFVRASLCVRAQEMLEALMHAFVQDVVEPQMDALAQRPLFERLGRTAHATWTREQAEDGDGEIKPPPLFREVPIATVDAQALREAAEEDDADEKTDGDLDRMYNDAVAVVTKHGKASVSLIQRHLKIGYNQAAEIIDRMEQEGVVGPATGAQPREVLVMPDVAPPTSVARDDLRSDVVPADESEPTPDLETTPCPEPTLDPERVLETAPCPELAHTWDDPGLPPEPVQQPNGRPIRVGLPQWRSALDAIRKADPHDVTPGWLARKTPVSREKAKVIIDTLRVRGLLPAVDGEE